MIFMWKIFKLMLIYKLIFINDYMFILYVYFKGDHENFL